MGNRRPEGRGRVNVRFSADSSSRGTVHKRVREDAADLRRTHLAPSSPGRTWALHRPVARMFAATATTRSPHSSTPATRRSTAGSCAREARSAPHETAGDATPTPVERSSLRTARTSGPFAFNGSGFLRGPASSPASCRPAPKPGRRAAHGDRPALPEVDAADAILDVALPPVTGARAGANGARAQAAWTTSEDPIEQQPTAARTEPRVGATSQAAPRTRPARGTTC
jgi:hypothetical protein